MKKIFATLLVVSLIICSFVGCNGIADFYSVKVTGDVLSLMHPIMPAYQAGTVVKIKAHPVTDVSLHVFVNGEEIPMSDFDSDYWGFEFVMPEENITIHLTYEEFYGRDEYRFDEVHYWVEYLKNETITKVSIQSIDYTERYNLIENRYSSKKEDIDNFKNILNQDLIKVDDLPTASNVYNYTFFYKSVGNGEMFNTIKFYDEFLHWNSFSSSQKFKFKDENFVLPTINDPDLVTYSFRYDGYSSDIKKYDDESFAIRYYHINSVEFIPYNRSEIDIEPKFYLDSRYGKINLLTPTIFELNGEYYEILSGEEYWAYDYHNLDNK